MERHRASGLLAAALALAVLSSGCLSGPAATPRVLLTFLSDPEVQASPGWTVGWAFETFESVADNATVTLTAQAPVGWSTRLLRDNFTFDKAHERHSTFLLVDVPSDAQNGTFAVNVAAALGADRAEITGSVRVARPDSNIVKNQSKVRMDYVGFLEDNRVFDTSIYALANSSGVEKWPDFKNSSAQRTIADYNPLEFTQGSHQVIKGWELGIEGMALGQGRALIIPSEDAYGRYMNQSINLTEPISIYNETTVAAFQPVFGTAPVEEAQFLHPLYGWAVRVVSVDNATGVCVYENLVSVNASYAPYGITASVGNISSALGTFELRYAPVLHESGTLLQDTGEVVSLNATAFAVRWQTEHRQTLAPYALYFLVFVRSVTAG